MNWEIIENSDLLCMNDIYMTRVLSVLTKVLHTFNQTCMRGWRSLLVQWKNLHVSTNWVTTTCICLTRSLSVTKSPITGYMLNTCRPPLMCTCWQFSTTVQQCEGFFSFAQKSDSTAVILIPGSIAFALNSGGHATAFFSRCITPIWLQLDKNTTMHHLGLDVYESRGLDITDQIAERRKLTTAAVQRREIKP